MRRMHKTAAGLAAILTVALVVPVFADGASDFQVNAKKASATLDDIAKLIDGIHARVASGGGGSATGTAAEQQPGGPAPAAGGGQVQALFAASCRCHTAGNAPKLTHIGANATHTAMWIAQYARNPKSKDPNSRMPAQRNVSAANLRTIATYLASLK